MFYINHNNFIYNNNCAKVIFTDKLSANIAFNTSFSSLEDYMVCVLICNLQISKIIICLYLLI